MRFDKLEYRIWTYFDDIRIYLNLVWDWFFTFLVYTCFSNLTPTRSNVSQWTPTWGHFVKTWSCTFSFCFFGPNPMAESRTLPPGMQMAPIPMKASKNKEEAFVHMDYWCIWFLQDSRQNSNHPPGGPRPMVVVFLWNLAKPYAPRIHIHQCFLRFDAFLGIGAYFDCPQE